MDNPSDSSDKSSYLGQFAWEQWNNQFIAVIFRRSPNGLNRYVLKRYVEQVLFQSDLWRHLSIYFSSMIPLVHAYTLTKYELELMRRILDFHLNDRLRLRITQSNDQLIEYEDLLEFISRVEDMNNKNPRLYNHSVNRVFSSIPTIPVLIGLPYTRTLLPIISPTTVTTSSSSIVTNTYHPSLPSSIESSIKSTSTKTSASSMSLKNAKIDGHGWIQINDVYLPFIIKNHQRLVPYAILISCKILEPNQLRTTLTHATLADITLINSMIRDCKIDNQFIPENTLLINVYHILIGTNKIIYVKILPIDNPTSKVNHQYKNILCLHGGSFYIKSHLIPFVCANQHSYISYNDVINIYPNLDGKLKCFTRAPRMHELEYLQLVQMYYNKENLLSSETLIIDIKELCQSDIILSKSVSLIEYHGKEKIKFDRILTLKMNASKNKRKNQASHENKQVKQKLKTNNKFQSKYSRSLADYFPKSSVLSCNSQQHN